MKSVVIALIFTCNLHLIAQRPSALNNGKFIEHKGETLLYGGKTSDQHFKISNLDLKPEQFHYGIGREAFSALLEPKFESVTEADKLWKDEQRFLVAKKGNEVKGYSVEDLIKHEVVNDYIDGEPIFAAYCILADLGAIYKRKYNDKLFTFALSGYTYYDPKVWNGLDGFVLWDRETESLWWPLVDKAVSGKMKDVKLQLLEETYWEDTTWAVVKEKYPNAQVLISGQDFKRPLSWKQYDDVSDIVDQYKN